MVSAKTKIVNPQGMHMRPAQLFVSTMAGYPCDVTILFGGKSINAKSIMHLMAACIKHREGRAGAHPGGPEGV